MVCLKRGMIQIKKTNYKQTNWQIFITFKSPKNSILILRSWKDILILLLHFKLV